MIDTLRDFIEENWTAFEQKCEEREIDPEDVLRYLNHASEKCPEYLFLG